MSVKLAKNKNLIKHPNSLLENYYPLKRATVKSDFKFYIQCRI